MTMREFIRANRQEIDEAIRRRYPATHQYTRFNDEDRRQWILNEEGLYRWAQAEGVPI